MDHDAKKTGEEDRDGELPEQKREREEEGYLAALKVNPFDEEDSSSSGDSRPFYCRDSSGSDSDYYRYMKNNFITEVYHAKDYDYSTNDEESQPNLSSRSSSFASLPRESFETITTASDMEAKGEVTDRESPKLTKSTSHQHMAVAEKKEKPIEQSDESPKGSDESQLLKTTDEEEEEMKMRTDTRADKKEDKRPSTSTSGSSDAKDNRPPKPKKPKKRQDKSSDDSHINKDDTTESNDLDEDPTQEHLEFTVTTPERSLVSSGTHESFFLDGTNKCLISSPTDFRASKETECQDIFLSQFIPSPKRNVKSLSWHISITDKSVRSDGYQLSIYKILLRRSKSWCGGNNWALFIDGKHIASGRVPLFTMSSEICFELPNHDGATIGAERRKATIEIRRKAWYRRKLKYKFKIGGNEYPTFYAQPFQALSNIEESPQATQVSESETDSDTAIELPPVAATTPKDGVSSTDRHKRGSAGSSISKALSPTASTLKSSANVSQSSANASHSKSKTVTNNVHRAISPAQMLITIPSTNTQVSENGKQRIYYQILIRIPALPHPIVVERRYKDFSQLCHMLRGELSLTLEETLGANKENKSVSNACQIKLDQFPTLPPKVYNPMVNQHRADFIKQRRLALQSFLIELISYDPKIVHCSEFLGFLGLHPITCTPVMKS